MLCSIYSRSWKCESCRSCRGVFALTCSLRPRQAADMQKWTGWSKAMWSKIFALYLLHQYACVICSLLCYILPLRVPCQKPKLLQENRYSMNSFTVFTGGGGEICPNSFQSCRLFQACVSYVPWWQGQLASGSLMVCSSVYAAGRVSLQHVSTASQLCRQAMHHDQAHHPALCHNIPQSYTCTSETLQSCQAQVIASSGLLVLHRGDMTQKYSKISNRLVLFLFTVK